ncbi:GNAT family N-acetyltransferase [Glaciihabitans sp. dw_435]|uniref:GNAT family N-acetyltransferase n=1 Tax=Glaciihabitans sp. dw_435 TaxID=2720081 RepID=UPI001BD60CA6|nr:GNAT family N-acetyltransferase [Glaciihabitans sp. dw_435]
MTLEIRFAGADDAALLHRLAAATFALACPPGTSPAAIDEFIGTTLSESAFAGYLADPARDLLIGEVDGVPSGYTLVVHQESADPDVQAALTVHPSSELSKCYVLADAHGGGIARELIEASVEASASRGAAGVWLGVNQENARANRFYEKNGFTVVGEKKFLLGGRLEEDFVRERVL